MRRAKATPRSILRGGQGPVNVPEGQLHPDNADEARMNADQSTGQETILGFKTFAEFLNWEYASSDTIDLKRIYCDVAGGLNQGLLLSQIVYWRLPSKRGAPTKLTINREGRLWLAKADRDWYGEIRLTKEEAAAARKILEARGLIICRTWKFGGNTCTHISLNEDEFLVQLATMLAIPEAERDAGPINRAKRVGPKKPGSKPTSGNRRKPTSELEDERHLGERKAGNMGNANPGISEIVIPELAKVQFPNYGDPHSGISVSPPPLTESPPETPAENPSEKKIIIVTNSNEANFATDDDDLPFENEKAAATGDGPWLAITDESNSSAVTGNGVPAVTGSVQFQHPGGTSDQATSTEKVPRTAAAPVETVDNWAILALPAVTLDVLWAREARSAPTNTVLRRAMSCSDVSRLNHMHDQLTIALGTTSSGHLVTRDLYLRLTDEEIEAAITAAQVDAKRGIQPFGSLAYHALDAMVGYPPSIEVLTKTRKRASGPSAGAPGTALGAAYEVKGAGARTTGTPTPPLASQVEAPPPEFKQGAVWRHVASGDEVSVVKRDGPDVHMQGANGIRVLRLLEVTLSYRPVTS